MKKIFLFEQHLRIIQEFDKLSKIIEKVLSTEASEIRDRLSKIVKSAICFKTTSITEFKDNNVT